jgi:signal transduction histidine kinase
MRLRFEPEPGLPLALGNEAHAMRIASHLLSNAIKFSPRGEEVLIRTFRVEDRVGLLVSDRGPGIPAQELPRIFDRFYRGPQAMKARAAGAGLGLYISAQLAGRIGGEIRVSSNPRRGSVFELLLAAQPGSPSRPEGTQLILPGHQAATGARSSTILAP